jgi:hypothetical protein
MKKALRSFSDLGLREAERGEFSKRYSYLIILNIALHLF